MPSSTELELCGIAASVVGWDEATSMFLIRIPESYPDKEECIYQLPYPYLTDMRYNGEIVSIDDPLTKWR